MKDSSLNQINWDEIWDSQMAKTSLKGEGVAYWGQKAQSFDSGERVDNFLDELLRRMKISPEHTVLDVGCGTGAISIPLAKRCAQVTALDWSPSMLEMLSRKIEQAGISNITPKCLDWSQSRIGIDVPVHDIVLASRSLPMGNLRLSLTRMNEAARQFCYLTWIAGSRENDIIVCEALGEEYHPYPEYLIIANILCTLGIKANVEIFQAVSNNRYLTPDEAVNETLRGREADIASREKIKNYLTNKLIFREGYYYQKTVSQWALIWWSKC
jgi:SAM-dependent methyltransferase